MSPIHLRANPEDYAPVVLLPGDPQRTTYISELTDSPRVVNEYRGLLGFTGRYKGVDISIQTTGMGCPSASIVVEELIQLGAKTFIRVGTCGGIGEKVNPTDLVIATGACPVDGATRTYLHGEPFAPVPSFEVVHTAMHSAESLGVRYHLGPVATVDVFYNPDPDYCSKWAERGVIAFEMESSAIFYLAARSGGRAGSLLTVSDMVDRGTYVSDEELARGVEQMARVALDTAVKLSGGESSEVQAIGGLGL